MEKNILFDNFNKMNKKMVFFIPILVLIFFLICNSAYGQQLKYGSLSVESYPRGAKVFLDNEYKGDTPLDLKNLATGQYTLRMVLDGYQDWTTTVVVLPILTVRISADLTPKDKVTEGSISVNSNPQGARVYLDNEYKGDTPLNIRNVTTGRHTVRIALADYQEWIGDVTVLSSRVERISVDLKPQEEHGSISINSNPQGADIYLDGDYVGLTPINLQNIPAGNYRVNILSSDYEEWVEEIHVSPKKTARINAKLVYHPSYGAISIYSDQKDAKIFLNGTYKKDTVKGYMLLEDVEAGDYEIAIIKDGFRVWVGDIKVFVDETTSIDVTMVAIFK